MTRIWTANIKYNLKNRVDVTVKGGIQMFAPTWDMVLDYKNGKIDATEYTKLYEEKMRKSYKNNKEMWDWFLRQKEIVFVCYCKPGDFCHRVLLAEIFAKLGADYRGEIDESLYENNEDED